MAVLKLAAFSEWHKREEMPGAVPVQTNQVYCAEVGFGFIAEATLAWNHPAARAQRSRCSKKKKEKKRKGNVVH